MQAALGRADAALSVPSCAGEISPSRLRGGPQVDHVSPFCIFDLYLMSWQHEDDDIRLPKGCFPECCSCRD